MFYRFANWYEENAYRIMGVMAFLSLIYAAAYRGAKAGVRASQV